MLLWGPVDASGWASPPCVGKGVKLNVFLCRGAEQVRFKRVYASVTIMVQIVADVFSLLMSRRLHKKEKAWKV